MAKKRKQVPQLRASGALASTLQRADQCYTTGDLATAERLYHEALERDPKQHKAVFLLGMIAHQREAHAMARQFFEAAIALHDAAPYYWLYLGRSLQALGEPAAALVHFKRARQLDPTLMEAWMCEGRLFRAVGAVAQAENTFAEAARLHPSSALPVEHLGELELSRGELEKAAAYFERAGQLDPQLIAAAINLGVVHQRSGRLEQAGACYERALRIDSESVVAAANLGWIEMKLGRLAAAEGHLRRATALDARYAPAWIDLASVLHELGEAREAIQCYRRGLELAPDPVHHSSLIALMLYDVESPPSAVLEEARRWAERHAPESAKQGHDLSALASAPRLRIGYVSPDFREHAVAHFSEPLIAAHDRSRFEVFCYSNTKLPDAVTERFARAAQFRVIRGESDEQVAAQIRADGIHVLVDLAGHTADNRLALFARAPAPVQATYLGYPGTTGVPAIEARFTDALADPEGADAAYSERLVRLPGAFFCFRPPDRAPEVSVSPASERGYVTFGSLNNYTKLSAQVFETWARVLARLPDARLVLQSRPFGDAAIRDRVWSKFEALGVARARVDLHGSMPADAHLALYGQIDIALDTFPWNGHTTTCLALHMGVPVVAVVGDRFGGRMGLSILTGAGLADWIAPDLDGYVELAVARARDVPALARLRGELRERLARSLLCDAADFARRMEAEYSRLWLERLREAVASPTG